MHAAKGLEFRAVALVGCDAEHLPLAEALAGAESDDARRLVEEREVHLLYVGCTRARESLLITYSGEVTPYLSRHHVRRC
jgi:superfamily I DNA/RNA helicase